MTPPLLERSLLLPESPAVPEPVGRPPTTGLVRVAVRTDADDARALACAVPESVTVCPREFVVVMTPPVARTDASEAMMDASLIPDCTDAREAEMTDKDD